LNSSLAPAVISLSCHGFVSIRIHSDFTVP